MQIDDKDFAELIRECEYVVDQLSCRCEPYWTKLIGKHEPSCKDCEIADLRDIVAKISKDIEVK